MGTYNKIAALGSSFAAGPGIEPLVDPDAGRSARNYPHLLAERLGANLVDLTISGATTATILEEPQISMTGKEYPPQIDGLPSDVDLVTITAGGNDLQFAGAMHFHALRRVDPTHPMLELMAPWFPNGIPEPTPARIDTMANGLAAIVAELRRRTNARVVLVDYLTVIGDATTQGTDWPHPADDTSKLVQIQAGVAAGFRLAADRSGADLVRASELSATHGVGSDDPWVNGFEADPDTTHRSFHPNASGMKAVAAMLVDHLGATTRVQ